MTNNYVAFIFTFLRVFSLSHHLFHSLSALGYFPINQNLCIGFGLVFFIFFLVVWFDLPSQEIVMLAHVICC